MPSPTPTPKAYPTTPSSNQFSNLMQNNTFAEQTGQMLNGADPSSALMMLGGMVGGSNSMSQLFNSGPSQRLATSGSGGGMFGNLFNMFGNNNQSGQSIMPGGDYNSATNQGGM